jgi:hypothetical protein
MAGVQYRRKLNSMLISNMEKSDKVVNELKEFSKVLETARDNGVSWHLAVDY